jgi:hypothetical protein
VQQIHAAGTWKKPSPPRNWFSTQDTQQHASQVAKLHRIARSAHAALLREGGIDRFREFVEKRTAWIAAIDAGQKLAVTTYQSTLQEWLAHPHVPGNASKLWKLLTGKKLTFGCPYIPEEILVSHFENLLRSNEALDYSPLTPLLIPPNWMPHLNHQK